MAPSLGSSASDTLGTPEKCHSGRSASLSEPEWPPMELSDSQKDEFRYVSKSPTALIKHSLAQWFGDCSLLPQQDQNETRSIASMTLRSFLRGQSQWINDPIISQWRNPSSKLLASLNAVDLLYQKWLQTEHQPFDPFFDPLWHETAKVLQEVGLPWQNNNPTEPEVFNPSWPFTFQEFERLAIVEKGKRVSDPDPFRYIAPWSEANCHCIRSLNQEIFRQSPQNQPIFLTDKFEADQAKLAAKIFGLEWHQVDLERQNASIDRIGVLTSNGQRPIIFAATLANTLGRSDNFDAIDCVSRHFPLLLHVDACRVFDYLTTASEEHRQAFNLPRLRLHHTKLGTSSCIVKGELFATTIVAGGSNAFIFPPLAAVLRPKTLGSQPRDQVEYVRAADSLLAGSRDALGPLMVYLQEVRFGQSGMREIYEGCALKRKELVDRLRNLDVRFHSHPYSLDLMIEATEPHQINKLSKLGGKSLGHGKLLLTIQPSVRPEDIESLMNAFSVRDKSHYSTIDPQSQANGLTKSVYMIRDDVIDTIRSKVQHIRVLSRTSCGYPINHVPYSALGPIVGNSLTVRIPDDWAKRQSEGILNGRKQSFGLLKTQSQESFKTAFTTGSTMGNRIGIHAALELHPKAFVYFSAASHFSVKKAVGDCDSLTNRWSPGRLPRFAEIAADDHGRMIPEQLVQQVLLHTVECTSYGETYELILFANMGTTFVGGRDDLVEIRRRLAMIGVRPSYIHVDGALDFGFGPQGICLGPPSSPYTLDDIPIVQGITLSHHKAMGIMVSGEVIFYDPKTSSELDTLISAVDPRAVFETWLAQETYCSEGLRAVESYCHQNAAMARRSLSASRVPIRYNENSFITVLERQPPWLIEAFGLAPEGDWVHFITMPGVSPVTINTFVREVAIIDMHCDTAFSYVRDSLNTSLGQDTILRRVTSRSAVAISILDIATKAILDTPRLQKIQQELDVATPRQVWKKYVHGSMSFAAIGDEGKPQAVFLTEAEEGRLILPSVLLVKSSLQHNTPMLRDVGMQLYGHVARLLNLNLKIDHWSFHVILYNETY